MTKFTKSEIGCYFDGSRGIYIGEAIQQLAWNLGWNTTDTVPVNTDDEYYHEVTNEAEDYLNTLTDDDVAFGPSEQGDWGLWHLCPDADIAGYDADCTVCIA
jgi:hypothetical protein